MLNYYLVDNKLTPDPDDCSARTQDVTVLNNEDIIKRATARGLTLTDTEAMGLMNEYVHIINDTLQEGYAISTPLVKIKPSVMGVLFLILHGML